MNQATQAHVHLLYIAMLSYNSILCIVMHHVLNWGSIEIVGEGGTAPFTYVWSNAMEGSKNDVQPGNYTIQVTDNSGCTKELEITISGPYVYTVENAVVTQPTEGNTNGSIDITLNGDGTGLELQLG
jgi:hypothetical protein